VDIPKTIAGVSTAGVTEKLADRRLLGGVLGALVASSLLKRSALARFAVIAGAAGTVVAKRRQTKPQWHDVPPPPTGRV
jgi:hypothetical protein